MSRRMVAVLAVILAVLCGAAAFVWLHAGGQSKTVVHFTPDPPANADASSAAASAARVLPGTRDPLGMMQYLRSVDWAKTAAVHGPVYDGRKLYEIRARKTGSAEVQVPAGKFSTSTIEVKVFDNGVEMNDAHFTLYVAKDEARTPVLLEAVLPFAAARVELRKKQ